MYFLSDDERRYMRGSLLPEARQQTVTDELRGWSWSQPPLKPVYGHVLALNKTGIGTSSAGSGSPPDEMDEPTCLRRVVAETIAQAKGLIYQHGAACLALVERWCEHEDTISDPALLQARTLRTFTVRQIVQRVESALARQPLLGADALAALAVPIQVELALDGRLLGLDQHLTVDAVNLPEMLVTDLVFGPITPDQRLALTGYALVLESLFDVPVNVGCAMSVFFVDGHVAIERSFHVLGEELRQMFIEIRDDRMWQIEHEVDPGLSDGGSSPEHPFFFASAGSPPDQARPLRGSSKAGSANHRRTALADTADSA